MGLMGRTGRIQQLWDIDLQQGILAAPLLADIDSDREHEIIVGTKNGSVIAIKQNGQKLWEYNSKQKVSKVEQMFLDTDVAFGISATPAFADFGTKKLILIATDLGHVLALNSRGQLQWTIETGGSIRGGFLIEDVNADGIKEIVFGSKDKILYVANAEGQVIKRFNAKNPIRSTPAFNALRKELIVGDDQGFLRSFLWTGKESWVFNAEGAILGTPSIGNLFGTQVNHVVFGTADSKIYAINDDGRPQWEYTTEGAVATKPLLVDLNNDKKLEVVVSCSDSNVYTLTSEGEKIWSFESNFWINSDPIVVDIDDDRNMEIIVGSYDHNIYVLDSRANYDLDYMPGVSGVVNQAGAYSDIMTVEPGDNVAKRIWTFKTKGIIMGLALNPMNKLLVVTTKNGHVQALAHIKKG